MSVGPILPPATGGEDRTTGQGIDVPGFRSLARRPDRVTPHGREALLASVLVHLLLAVALVTVPPELVLPGTSSRLLLAMTPAPDDQRIPMAFVQDAPRPPEPNPDAPAASDRDRRRGQEERPPDPAIAGPYSRGNTPALIAEGPLGGHESGPPSPSRAPLPTAPPSMPPEGETGEADETPTRTADERSRGAFDAGESRGKLLFAPPNRGSSGPGEADDDLEERAARLRRALDQMGAGGSVGGGGGVPYRFDNPTAGLSTPTGTLSFDTKGFDWGPYARRIYWIIWSNWHARMPPAVYMGVKGSVTVRFVIGRDGRITGIRILSESGVPAYDSAAVLALEASSPLPPFPESFPWDSEGVMGRFLYNTR